MYDKQIFYSMFKKNSNFLMNFEVYKGMSDFVVREQKKSMIGSLTNSELEGSSNPNNNNVRSFTSLTTSQDPTVHDKMKDFNCDQKWPVCLYDFTFKNKVVTQFCHKVSHPLSIFIVDDHFYPTNPDQAKKTQELEARKQRIGDSEFSMVLREHQPHVCRNDNPNHLGSHFVRNFKILFMNSDDILLKNMNLNLKIFDENDISKKLRAFKEEIAGKKYPVIMSDNPEAKKGNMLW